MGTAMATHLVRAGYPVRLHTRTRSKAEPLIRLGATWADSPAEAAADAQVFLSIVGHPADVQSVYLGDDGVLQTMRPGGIIIDMTTSSPALAVEIHRNASAKGIAALDAPVTGGDVGAREARLAILVGGDAGAFEQVKPILDKLGKNIVHHGGPGLGQQAKLCNQIMIAGTMIGMVEGLQYAREAGVDPQKLIASISQGAAGSWSLNNLAPRILKGDLEPGFTIEHFVKDLKLALDECRRMGIQLRGLDLVRKTYESLLRQGYGRKGTQALMLAM